VGKLSKEERAKLEAQLAADDADDPEDDQVELQFDDGTGFRGTFRRARSVAKARGFKLDPDPDPAPDETEDEGPKQVRFGGRRLA
jgi:hypothetical protein